MFFLRKKPAVISPKRIPIDVVEVIALWVSEINLHGSTLLES